LEPAYTAYFDGACEPINPGGIASWGYVVYQGDTIIHSACGTTGNPLSATTTNNVAEYTGLIKALKYCIENNIRNLIVKGDSQLVINQMKGTYKVGSHNLIGLYNQACVYARQFETIVFQWIPREENKIADSLTKRAYENAVAKHNIYTSKLPFGKFKGRSIYWIIEHCPRYAEWLTKQEWVSPYLKKMLEVSSRQRS